MHMPPGNRLPQSRPVPQPPPPPTPTPKKHFRWWPFLLVLSLLTLAWVISNAELAFCWGDVMDLLNVQNRGRYTMLACLGVVCVAVVAIAKVLRRKPTP